MLLFVSGGCAGRRHRTFSPPGEADAATALTAWKDAVARVASAPGARLLYDARISQGLGRSSGTLAVVLGDVSISAVLTGPFGAPLARYESGALTGENIRPVPIDASALRALVEGVWREPGATVAGISGSEARLTWPGVEGVLDVPRAVFESLRVERREGRVEATYGGARNPYPEKVDAEDLRTGSHLKLTLLAVDKS